MKISLSEANSKYPRLTAALRDRCLLTEGEASSALYSVANACNAGSEAVMHFGGPAACVRAAFRGRAKSRRYSGNPMWAGWKDRADDNRSTAWEPTWPDRMAQMRKIASEIGGNDHYLKKDLEIDQDMIKRMVPGNHKFLWFVRRSGTSLENLSLPRAQKSVREIAFMDGWLAIYLVDLHRGLVKVSPTQAIEIASKTPPYRVIGDNLVAGPTNTSRGTLAQFSTRPVPGKIGVFDVVINISGFSWSITKLVRPQLFREEFELIESTIMDHLISKTSSLFTKIRAVRYEVSPDITLSSERFRLLYRGPEGMHFPRITYRDNGFTNASTWIPTDTKDDAESALKWLPIFKQSIKAIRGDLKGVKFNIENPEPSI